jgi:Domain of unknown function (DUF4395)
MTDNAIDERGGAFSRAFRFPNPVNEKAARVVAAGVLVIAVVTLMLSVAVAPGWLWLCAGLAAGFAARMLTGPTFSPLGRLATQVIAPRLGVPKLVAGPPKRFAQGIGLVVTAAATAATALGSYGVAQILLLLVIIASALESIFAYCIGCKIFTGLMRAGLVPEETCEACLDVRGRRTPDALNAGGARRPARGIPR